MSRMEKAESKMPHFQDASVDERVEILVSETKAYCERIKMHVTLWLLFDTAAARDPFTRDAMLKAFKRHARQHRKSRSVAEGAKWLALNLHIYRTNFRR